jgi:hypothetical protein
VARFQALLLWQLHIASQIHYADCMLQQPAICMMAG